MLSIRPLLSDDHRKIVDIWHRGWHDAHAGLVPKGVLNYRAIDHFWSWLHCSTDQFYVAVEGEILGFVSMQGSEIVKLYVDVQSRGNGTAAKLLSFAERRIHDQNLVDSVLFCIAGNARAERFYEREGWILTQTFSDKLWLPQNAVSVFIADTHRYTKRLT
ncbi:GNAT family N-acetyltransferase [Sulfitobacter sp. AS92]|uniref:GNAT family N-acetyltransferase n=1 Tax=Sulfitobacter sp. AS92 TaxID=3135783 RepID=UPI00317677CA